ncbi:uncharacterized protein DMAD_11420 [Drosophila madeirensis]|uniref:Uncharacterized protein n=1 Tax=Drosophila madeirensis TaxID=30013 RepID=A0AAU9FD45_DROMD
MLLLPCCVPLLLLLPFIGQALCGTALPQQKLRIVRDTRNLPTDLFKPVGGGGGGKSEIPNEVQQGQPTDAVEFLEKTDGEVEAVTASGESYPEYPQYKPQPTPFDGRNLESPRSNRRPNANGNNFPSVIGRNRQRQRQNDTLMPEETEEVEESEETANNRNYPVYPQYVPPPPPSFGTFQRSSAPRSSFVSGRPRGRPSADPFLQDSTFPSTFHSTFPQPFPSNPVFSGGSPNALPYSPMRSSMTPFFAGGGSPIGSGFPVGSGPPVASFSNNFQRSEHYSYTSDGNGPPQIEHNVYDSRMPRFGSASRNFF